MRALNFVVFSFMQTRRTAGWLAEKMTKDGHAVAVLSGDLTVEQRIAVLDRFRAGLERVLITTNVLARGTLNNDLLGLSFYPHFCLKIQGF